MRSAGEAEGGALVGQGAALAGEFVLFGAVDDVEEAAGGRDQGLGPVERGKGEGVGAEEGRGVELALGQRGEEGGGRGGGGVFRVGADVALVVDAERALADGEAKLRADAHDNGGVGEIVVLEPEAELGALGQAEALEPGIGADFARDAGARVGGAAAVAGAAAGSAAAAVFLHDLGLALTWVSRVVIWPEDGTLAGFEVGVRRVAGVCVGGSQMGTSRACSLQGWRRNRSARCLVWLLRAYERRSNPILRGVLRHAENPPFDLGLGPLVG